MRGIHRAAAVTVTGRSVTCAAAAVKTIITPGNNNKLFEKNIRVK